MFKNCLVKLLHQKKRQEEFEFLDAFSPETWRKQSRIQDESWESLQRSPVKTSRRSSHDQEDRRKCLEQQVGVQPTPAIQCEKRNHEWMNWLKSQNIFKWMNVCKKRRSEHQFSHLLNLNNIDQSPDEAIRRKILCYIHFVNRNKGSKSKFSSHKNINYI